MERPARAADPADRRVEGSPGAERELIRAAQAYLAARRGRRHSDPSLEAAWDRFYRRYNPLVVRTILDFAPGDRDVADCAQHSWLHIVANLDKFRCHHRDDGRFRGWLRVLVRRVLLDRASRGTSRSR